MLRNILLIHIANNLIFVSLPDVYQHVGIGILGELERCVVESWVGLWKLEYTTILQSIIQCCKESVRKIQFPS